MTLAWDFDLSAPKDGQEVFLLCMQDGDETIIMAARMRFEPSGRRVPERERLVEWAWASTWDGRRILHPFVPYAWAPLPETYPEPGEAP